MNNRAVTLSAMMAFLSVLLMMNYVSTIEEQAKNKYGGNKVVLIASKDIGIMETIDDSYLSQTVVPTEFIQPYAIQYDGDVDKTRTDDLKRRLTGFVAMVPIKKGEQITQNKISEPNIRTGLSPRVNPGKRAVSIPVNEITGVAKLIKPGDRVDVIAILSSRQGALNTKIAKTVLQDVPILAVGRVISGNMPRLVQEGSSGGVKVRNLTSFDGFVSVTIEVFPQHAQMLSLLTGDRDTTITLALRNNDDTEQAALSDVTNWEVLGVRPQQVQPDNARSPASSGRGGPR